MKSFLRFFGFSTFFAFGALGFAWYLGYQSGGTGGAWSALLTALLLGVLEVSLSFDNAVVNAKVLSSMSPFWQRMFLTLGMFIAVFGMRIVFPLFIVWVLSALPFDEVVRMTWEDPRHFQEILENQHVLIAGFGGAFLWMVFTKFFFDFQKDIHWVPGLEKIMSRMGKVEAFWVAITMIITMTVYFFMADGTERNSFLMAAMLGIITYIVIEGLGAVLDSDHTQDANLPRAAVGAGLMSFLYLEVLDASFSFDGVIGAFAISSNLYIIALGLGIGAFFVRSLTIKLVADKTLSTYRFLEHGAFWAIGALSLIMYASATGFKVPELVSGLVGITFIGLSFIASLRHNRLLSKPGSES